MGPVMDPALVRFHLDTPTCAAVAKLPQEERVHCHVPGGPFGAYAWTSGETPTGWKPLLACGGGSFVRLEEEDCSHCPLGALPPDAFPVAVEARADGLRVDLALPDANQLRVILRHWAARGQSPRIVNGRMPDADRRALALIDMGLLTPRQREALETAARIGYFSAGGYAGVSDLAEQMGCSRSTAHEHLRKGLERLLRATLA